MPEKARGTGKAIHDKARESVSEKNLGGAYTGIHYKTLSASLYV